VNRAESRCQYFGNSEITPSAISIMIWKPSKEANGQLRSSRSLEYSRRFRSRLLGPESTFERSPPIIIAGMNVEAQYGKLALDPGEPKCEVTPGEGDYRIHGQSHSLIFDVYGAPPFLPKGDVQKLHLDRGHWIVPRACNDYKKSL
jgi:hypothetical protein